MPIVDNADCIEAVEGYTIDDVGNISMNISWKSCDNTLKSYYNNSLDKNDMEKFFFNKKVVASGQCDDATASFMNDQMLVSI